MTKFMQPHIAPELAERIMAELSAIEHEQGVKVLLAVESGSRAWGFPSKDSDYDVRFIYLRQARDYLTVVPRRDVIERPVDAVLDVSGWDIRKALRLLLRSNAVLQEWISSPIRYIDCTPIPGQLRELIEEGADLNAFEYHYYHLASRSFDEINTAGGSVRLKSYCYALRAALSLCWLRDRKTPPPMDINSIQNGLDLSVNLREVIVELVDKKTRAFEQGMDARAPDLDTFMTYVLNQPPGQVCARARPDMTARVDAMFAATVLNGSPVRTMALPRRDGP
jgi:predicted nucleotidyltransferase